MNKMETKEFTPEQIKVLTICAERLEMIRTVLMNFDCNNLEFEYMVSDVQKILFTQECVLKKFLYNSLYVKQNVSDTVYHNVSLRKLLKLK